MAGNVEGEALRKMAGASSQPGTISAVTGWLSGRKSKETSSGTAKKSGIDYHNEELAKRYDYEREEGAKTAQYTRDEESKATEFARQGHRRTWIHQDSQNDKIAGINYDQSGSVGAKFHAPRQTPASNAKSSGGQGTSGNAKGPQFNKPARTSGTAPKA